jgi:large subunit ribosomal protein L3
MKNIIGRKVGMTSIFTADGRYVPVTVIEATPNIVLQVKTVATDGYASVALAFADARKNGLTKPEAGRFKKLDLAPKKHIREFRKSIDGAPEVGGTVSVDVFAAGEHVDVVGISKGHGFAGGIKRHNFHGGSRTHGQMIHRQPGSNGDTNSGHTHRGSRRPGHYGVDRTTHQNLEIVRADLERNLLLVMGPVPGPKNALVIVSAAVRPPKVAKEAPTVKAAAKGKK